MTDWPIGAAMNGRPEKNNHVQASTYKELCKGRATELYKLLLKNNEGKQQRKIFSTLTGTFSYNFRFLSLTQNIRLCVENPKFYSDVDKSVTPTM